MSQNAHPYTQHPFFAKKATSFRCRRCLAASLYRRSTSLRTPTSRNTADPDKTAPPAAAIAFATARAPSGLFARAPGCAATDCTRRRAAVRTELRTPLRTTAAAFATAARTFSAFFASCFPSLGFGMILVFLSSFASPKESSVRSDKGKLRLRTFCVCEKKRKKKPRNECPRSVGCFRSPALPALLCRTGPATPCPPSTKVRAKPRVTADAIRRRQAGRA